MKFGFVDEHRHIWPVKVMCAAFGSVGQRLLCLALSG